MTLQNPFESSVEQHRSCQSCFQTSPLQSHVCSVMLGLSSQSDVTQQVSTHTSPLRPSRLYKRGRRRLRGHRGREHRQRTSVKEDFSLSQLIRTFSISSKLPEQMETMKSARKNDTGEVGRYDVSLHRLMIRSSEKV